MFNSELNSNLSKDVRLVVEASSSDVSMTISLYIGDEVVYTKTDTYHQHSVDKTFES